MEFELSKALPGDLIRLAEVWEASVRATHDFVSESDIQEFASMVCEALPRIRDIWVVRDPVGESIALMSVHDRNIDMLFVHPDWFGNGVGTLLMRHAIESLGAVSVDVNEQNPRTCEFYKKFGFELVARSELDGNGKPYPILHLKLLDVAGEC